MKENWNIKHGAGNIIDLSYPIGPDMTLLEVYRPLIIKDNNPYGRHVNKKTGYPERGYYARTIYQMSEGHGTHVEACSHAYGELGKNIDQYPLSRYIAPAVVINIEAKTKKNPDYNITVKDLLLWEQMYGEIPAGACIVIYSGRSKYFGNPKKYFGIDNSGEKHYPGIGVNACKWLVKNRDISIIATDCPTIDSTQQSKDGKRPFLPAPSRDIVQDPETDIIIIEYLANVDSLPESGALIIAAPINFTNAAQATARILGVLPE
jgi:kynurenine formamidase